MRDSRRLLTCCLLGAAPFAAWAQAPAPAVAPQSIGDEPAPGEPGFAAQLFDDSRSTLLGDMHGLRTFLAGRGVTLGLQETSEVFGNATGGARRGAAYNGLTTMSLGLDAEKAFGWDGATFNASAFQIHGRNISAENLGTLNTASGIEASRATRLWELWYQQALLDGRADVRVGQQSLDQEFILSQGAALFINTAMGWPILPSVDLYGGGPAYPLASLGVRLRAQPSGSVAVLAGVFDDNPPGGPFADDGQLRGAAQSGTAFHLGTGALFIGEAQFARNQPAAGAETAGLAGTFKLGFYYDTARFPDQRIDTAGRKLASPASTGAARMLPGAYMIYGVADQVVWRPDPDGPRALDAFARIMGAPGDRGAIDFGFNLGLVLKAPLPGRDGDALGLSLDLVKISPNASGLDKDRAFYSGAANPVRSSESVIEVTYQCAAAPWWVIQPDFQYVFLPGAGIADPNAPGRRVGNEAVFGVRTAVTF